MSRRRHKAHTAKQIGEYYADKAAKGLVLNPSQVGAGKVVTEMEAQDIPLASEIDLGSLEAKRGEGNVHPHIRDADPMRPFTGPATTTARKGGLPSDYSEHGDMVRAMPGSDAALRTATSHLGMGKAIFDPAGGLPTNRHTVLDHIVRNEASYSTLDAQVAAKANMPLPLSDAWAHGVMGQQFPKLDPFRRDRAKASLQWPPEPGDYAKLRFGQHLSPEEKAAASQYLTELASVGAEPVVMQRVTESCYHKLIECWRAGNIMIPSTDDGKAAFVTEEITRLMHSLKSSAAYTGIFLLQHDWAGAFSKSSGDFMNGEIRPPYPVTVFETRIHGHRTILTLMESDPNRADVRDVATLHIETTGGWAYCGAAVYDRCTFKLDVKKSTTFAALDGLMQKLANQARAVLIALDAEVVTKEVVRAPYKLNQAREKKGKLPILDHHTISLAHRHRYGARPLELGQTREEQRSRRLHWVRGHFRHYSGHKTWIKWHMRGDPDLGFIDKEYKL